MLSVVNEDGATESGSLIDEIVREGARRMLAAAPEGEVDQYRAHRVAQKDEAGRHLLVCNGRLRPHTVTTAAGPVEVTAPRVNDRRVGEATGEHARFSSAVLPPLGPQNTISSGRVTRPSVPFGSPQRPQVGLEAASPLRATNRVGKGGDAPAPAKRVEMQ